MPPPRWQILIPTLVDRWHFLSRLLARLRPQVVPGKVGILTLCDNGDESIGVKRQRLLEAATADYVSMADDDDLLPDYHVGRILSVLDGPDPPDVVGFRLRMFTSGKLCAYAVHSYDAVRIEQPLPKGCRKYERLPNHLNPVRRELALKVGYMDANHGEDGDYAVRLSKLVPRPRETFIDAVLYEYEFIPHDFREPEMTNDKRRRGARKK